MVNNGLLKGIFSPLFFFILLMGLATNVDAQKISKYYTSLKQADGTLFFIMPKQSFSNGDNIFDCDLTYKTQQDERVTLNFSLFCPNLIDIDSIVLQTEEKSVGCKTEKIFVDIEKKKYHHRYSSKFAFVDVRSFYASNQTPTINLYSNKKVLNLSIKQKKWEKDSGIVSKIFDLIVINRE